MPLSLMKKVENLKYGKIKDKKKKRKLYTWSELKLGLFIYLLFLLSQ
jgi:hypothetical protein